jgi:tRNA threonylcarbamoyladenosine biosynthesis protein TsaE
MKIDISKISDLKIFAKKLSKQLSKADIIYLHGDLGSGKTTLVQLIIKNLGYLGRVKSPTYNLYESYSINDIDIIHMDLYRMANPEELYYLGVEDIFNNKNIVFIEWPEKAKEILPAADYSLYLEILDNNHRELKINTNKALV